MVAYNWEMLHTIENPDSADAHLSSNSDILNEHRLCELTASMSSPEQQGPYLCHASTS